MKHVFYFMAIFAIWNEIINACMPQKVNDFLHSIVEKSKGKKNTSKQSFYLLMMIGYFSWCFVGLFTFQWPMFMMIFILSFIMFFIKNSNWSKRIDGVISLAILFFIILNAYHFKIDVWSFLKNLI